MKTTTMTNTEIKTVQHYQQCKRITIDLNNNDDLPMTKAGKPAMLRSHAVRCHGQILHRLFSQQQVAQIKKTGQWITINDRDWISRVTETAWILVSPEEMEIILSK